MAYEAYKKEQSSLIFDLMELRLSSNLLELPAGMDLKVERIFDTITKVLHFYIACRALTIYLVFGRGRHATRCALTYLTFSGYKTQAGNQG